MALPTPPSKSRRGLLRRLSLIVLYVFGLLIGGGTVGGLFWLYTSLPFTEGTVEVSGGLEAPAEILRDRWGVPHIFAQSAADAYFALGFVHAQDRLWQMETMRRLGAGRLAEVAGRYAVASDRFMRTLGFHRLVKEQFRRLDPAVRRGLKAYAAGVNAWLEAAAGSLPPEFTVAGVRPEPWRPTDSLLWGKVMGLRLSGNWRDELLRARLAARLPPERIEEMWPGTPPETRVSASPPWRGLALDRLAAAVPEAPGLPRGASNAWAVSGTRTATGKPILANDPHLGFGAPVLWYLARITAPDLHVTGATVPGVPFTVLGHNRRIAWGMSSTQSDLQDLFIERIDPADSGRYLTPEGSAPFATRTETIRVRGRDDVVLTVRETRHGPVISDIVDGVGQASASGPGRVLALSATFLGPDDLTPQAIYRLNRADGWQSFLAAMKDFDAPQQNVVYADVDGNIGFLAPGRVPIRRSGRGRIPRPGWTGEADWRGFVPYDALPRFLNPASGHVISANQRIVEPDYPYFVTDDWDAPYRARRIRDLLGEIGAHTLETTTRIQLDSLSLMAKQIMPLMADIEAPSPMAREALSLLEDWDGAMSRERPEPLIFSAWLRELNRAIYGDELGDLMADYWGLRPSFVISVLTDRRHWCDDIRTPRTEDCPGLIAAALARAVQRLAERFGADVSLWRWGDVHLASFHHPVFAGVPGLGRYAQLAIASDGGNYTVNRGASHIGNEVTPFEHIHGAGLRAVYDLSHLDGSRFMIATGQSGNPMSPHYGDLLKDWRDGKSLSLGLGRAELGRKAAGILNLVPAGSPGG